jgi:hypothetical protein
MRPRVARLEIIRHHGLVHVHVHWMALAHYVLWDPSIDSSSHWFMMQIGMILGFLTSWPVNRWLLTKGVNEPMMAAGRTPIPAPMVPA